MSVLPGSWVNLIRLFSPPSRLSWWVGPYWSFTLPLLLPFPQLTKLYYCAYWCHFAALLIGEVREWAWRFEHPAKRMAARTLSLNPALPAGACLSRPLPGAAIPLHHRAGPKSLHRDCGKRAFPLWDLDCSNLNMTQISRGWNWYFINIDAIADPAYRSDSSSVLSQFLPLQKVVCTGFQYQHMNL